MNLSSPTARRAAPRGVGGGARGVAEATAVEQSPAEAKQAPAAAAAPEQLEDLLRELVGVWLCGVSPY